MKTTVKIKGKILFDPPDRTQKHRDQGKWKKVAYVDISGDICEYYSWFLKKRFNLYLTRPLRKAHVTFINDSERDMGKNVNRWEMVKNKWQGKTVEVELHLNPKTDGNHWWLTVTEESRTELHSIRRELGLGRPYFGLHMTIGRPLNSYDESFEPGSEKIVRDNLAHSKYLHELAKKGLI